MITHDGLRHHRLHFLRHHANVSSITSVIAEAIEANTVAEMAEENDVVFERDVGSPSAATSTATAATPATAASACTTATAATATRRADVAAPTAATHAYAAARGCSVCDPSGANIS